SELGRVETGQNSAARNKCRSREARQIPADWPARGCRPQSRGPAREAQIRFVHPAPESAAMDLPLDDLSIAAGEMRGFESTANYKPRSTRPILQRLNSSRFAYLKRRRKLAAALAVSQNQRRETA